MKMNKPILISIIFTMLLISSVLYFSKNDKEELKENFNNVFVIDGKQIIEITAKGGYIPVHSFAKAGIPTIIRVDTNGTFDCSSNIRIPSLDISKNLPMSGKTDIDIGIQKVGKFDGTCGMGMYPFSIDFQ